MRKTTLVGVVIAALIIVGTAAALGQSSPDGERPGGGFYGWMHGWMTDNIAEMPMHGGSSNGWSHDEMHSWMTDNIAEMPMHGGSSNGWSHDEMHSWMTDNIAEMPMHGGSSNGWSGPSSLAPANWLSDVGAGV